MMPPFVAVTGKGFAFIVQAVAWESSLEKITQINV
jgi:hypothetical protein